MHNPSNKLEAIDSKLKSLDKMGAMELLLSCDDKELWELYKVGHHTALSVLFKKYHRTAMLLVYKRLSVNYDVRWVQVEDATADFIERILVGKYNEIVLKKNFLAFMIHYVSSLAKDRVKLAANSKVQSFSTVKNEMTTISPQLSVEEKIDFRKVIDFIPRIPNHVYRMVLYLIFIIGYDSSDLTEVLGQREKAYDKRSRALKAFRLVLEKEGMLNELR